MKAVSDAGRGLKHSGIIASRAEVQRFARSTREFLSDGARVVFDVDFDNMSLTDLIPREEVRKPLARAEAAARGRRRAWDARRPSHSMRSSVKRAPTESGSELEWRLHRLRDPHGPQLSAFHLHLEDRVGPRFAKAWDAR